MNTWIDYIPGWEFFWLWLANRLPRQLVYWCGIRMIVHATTGKYGNQVVPELYAMAILDRWEKP